MSKSRWLSFTFLAVLVSAAVIWVGTDIGMTQVQPSPQTTPFDLTGKWKTEKGETVIIRHDQAGHVTARFSPPVRCWDQTRSEYFSAPLTLTGRGDSATYKLEGDRYIACTNTKKMIDDCHLDAVFQTKFKAEVSADGNTISGTNFRDGWSFDIQNGRYVNCQRSSRYDDWQDFTLTRETDPTPTPTPTPGGTTTVDPTPTPTPSTYCQGVPPKTADDDLQIDRMIEKLANQIAAAERLAESFETKANAGDKAAAQYVKLYRTKAADLTKLKVYWTNLRLVPCIPREIIQLLKMVLDGRTELCPSLCDRTADWIGRITPGPQGQAQKIEFLTLCKRYCGN